jgi:hypothetical protein
MHDDSFRSYLGFFNAIEPGMTRGEVLTVLEEKYPEDCSVARPKVAWNTENSLGFFMNEQSCEGVFLELEHSRVARKVYSPD